MIKTNQQMVKILRLYNGTNDIGVFDSKKLGHDRKFFILPGRFKLDKLKIFKNGKSKKLLKNIIFN